MIHAPVKKNVIRPTEIVTQDVCNAEIHGHSRRMCSVACGLNGLIDDVNRRDMESASCQLDGIRPRAATDLQERTSRQLLGIQDTEQFFAWRSRIPRRLPACVSLGEISSLRHVDFRNSSQRTPAITSSQPALQTRR